MAVYKDFITATGYGDIRGLCGINCRHSFFGVTETQKPAYTDEQLDDINAKSNETREWVYKNSRGEEVRKSLDGYAQTQEMRRMENEMRKQRSRTAAHKAANNDELARQARTFYRAQSAEYKRFCAEMGLRPDMQRVYADGLGRV